MKATIFATLPAADGNPAVLLGFATVGVMRDYLKEHTAVHNLQVVSPEYAAGLRTFLHSTPTLMSGLRYDHARIVWDETPAATVEDSNSKWHRAWGEHVAQVDAGEKLGYVPGARGEQV